MFPSKAPKPEQDPLSGLDQSDRRETRDKLEKGTGSCCLTSHIQPSSIPALSALSPKYYPTVLLCWYKCHRVSLRGPSPSMSRVQRNSTATKPTPGSKRGYTEELKVFKRQGLCPRRIMKASGGKGNSHKCFMLRDSKNVNAEKQEFQSEKMKQKRKGRGDTQENDQNTAK